MTLGSFQYASLLEGGSFVLGYSGYLGILFECKFFNGENNYGYSSFWKGFGRILVIGVLALPLVLPLILLNDDSLDNVYALMMC